MFQCVQVTNYHLLFFNPQKVFVPFYVKFSKATLIGWTLFTQLKGHPMCVHICAPQKQIVTESQTTVLQIEHLTRNNLVNELELNFLGLFGKDQ